ncbi:MAG: hypothetical protein ABI977_06240 [Acidobacteriota bacterium]
MFLNLRVRIGLLFLACLFAGCGGRTAPASVPAPLPPVAASSSSTPSPPRQVVALAVSGLVATLEDEVRDLPDGQIAWSTYWKLCWDAYAGAQEYELGPMTGEGGGRRLVRQAGTCLRIEVAKGQNAKAQGLFNRELMLASLSGQLAYRVRAVMGDGRVSQWSPLAIVGQSSKPVSSSRK